MDRGAQPTARDPRRHCRIGSGGIGGMRTSSDSFPIVLTLAAFVLMFLGQSTYERLLDAWIVGQLAPWLCVTQAEAAVRLSAVAVAGGAFLYVTEGLYFYLRRQFARQSARTPQISMQRDVWL